MPSPTLLLHLDDSDGVADRTRFAIDFARLHACHLTGLASVGTIPFAAAAGPALGGADRIASTVNHMMSRAARRIEVFSERCQAAGVVSFDSQLAEDEDTSALIRASHASDLLIVGQGTDAETHRLAEDVVIESARPVLLLPSGPAPETPWRNVLVAWDNSRACARAIADALPWMRTADRVHLLACETPMAVRPSMASVDIAAAAGWLARHGIASTHSLETTTIDVGNALLSRASDWDIDLLVMGAYGHARWTERLIGGVTRTVLQTMTVPVLLSH